MDNNNQININELSGIQENDDNFSQSQMSLLNEMNNAGNFMGQIQFNNNINNQIPMNNFQNNYNPFYNPFYINNNNNFNIPNFNNNQLFMYNNNPRFMNNNNNQQILNNINICEEINLCLMHTNGHKEEIKISPYAKGSDLFDIVKEKFQIKNFCLLSNGYVIQENNQPLFYSGIKNNDKILILELYLDENVDIDVSIIVTNDNHPKFNINNLNAILKLCLLKEIGKKIKENFYDIYKKKLSERINYIMDILIYKNIPVEFNKTINSVMGTLKKLKGENIVNFAKFVEGYLNSNDLNEIINLLDHKIKNDTIKLINCLGIYNEYAKLFEDEFNKVKKDSLFDYSLVSLTIVDRKDIKTFEQEKKIVPIEKKEYYFMEQA